MSDHPSSGPEPVGARVLDLAKRRAAAAAETQIQIRVEKSTKTMLVNVEQTWMEHPELESIEVWAVQGDPFETPDTAAFVSTFALSRPHIIEKIVRDFGYKIRWNETIEGDVDCYHGKKVFSIYI